MKKKEKSEKNGAVSKFFNRLSWSRILLRIDLKLIKMTSQNDVISEPVFVLWNRGHQ